MLRFLFDLFENRKETFCVARRFPAALSYEYHRMALAEGIVVRLIGHHPCFPIITDQSQTVDPWCPSLLCLDHKWHDRLRVRAFRELETKPQGVEHADSKLCFDFARHPLTALQLADEV